MYLDFTVKTLHSPETRSKFGATLTRKAPYLRFQRVNSSCCAPDSTGAALKIGIYLISGNYHKEYSENINLYN